MALEINAKEQGSGIKVGSGQPGGASSIGMAGRGVSGSSNCAAWQQTLANPVSIMIFFMYDVLVLGLSVIRTLHPLQHGR